jgi:threonine efflux protein
VIWLGIQAWGHAGTALAPATSTTLNMNCWQAWRLGFSTNLANPKVIVFYGSIFVALFAPDTPGCARVAARAAVNRRERW